MKARCRGCNSPFSASPSAVMISDPSYATARARQLLARLPSRRTVHAPHWPWSQPFFGLVIPSRSRRASSSVVRVSTVRCRSAPSTQSVISASKALLFRSRLFRGQPALSEAPIRCPRGSMTDGQRSSAVVRRAGTRGVHLVFAALGRLVGVRRPLLLAHGVGRCGVGWVPRVVLDAGSLNVLFRTFRRFLGVYRSSLFAHRTLLVRRPPFDGILPRVRTRTGSDGNGASTIPDENGSKGVEGAGQQHPRPRARQPAPIGIQREPPT